MRIVCQHIRNILPYLLFLKKQQNLKLSSSANFRLVENKISINLFFPLFGAAYIAPNKEYAAPNKEYAAPNKEYAAHNMENNLSHDLTKTQNEGALSKVSDPPWHPPCLIRVLALGSMSN